MTLYVYRTEKPCLHCGAVPGLVTIHCPDHKPVALDDAERANPDGGPPILGMGDPAPAPAGTVVMVMRPREPGDRDVRYDEMVAP